MVGDLYSQFNEAANYTRKFIFKITGIHKQEWGHTPVMSAFRGPMRDTGVQSQPGCPVKLDEITNWDPLSEYLGMLRVQIPECRKEHSQAAVLQGKRWAVFAKERFL